MVTNCHFLVSEGWYIPENVNVSLNFQKIIGLIRCHKCEIEELHARIEFNIVTRHLRAACLNMLIPDKVCQTTKDERMIIQYSVIVHCQTLNKMGKKCFAYAIVLLEEVIYLVV